MALNPLSFVFVGALFILSTCRPLPLSAQAQTTAPKPSDGAEASSPQKQELQHLHQQGAHAYEKGDYAEAERAWQTGLQRATEMGDQHSIGTFLLALGSLYETINQFDQALEDTNRALDLFQKLDDTPDSAAALGNLGNIYHALAQDNKALEYQMRALLLFEKLNSPNDLAGAYNDIGNSYLASGQYDKAPDYYNRALQIQERQNDKRALATTLDNLGLVYRRTGRYEKALALHQRALALKETLNNPAETAVSLNSLGLVYTALGQYDRALECHTRALELRRKLNIPREVARSLNNLGEIYFKLGQTEKSLDYFTQALAIRIHLPNPRELALSYANLATAYDRLDQLDKAADFRTRALTIFQQLGNPQEIADSLAGLGRTYLRRKQYDKAEEQFTRALAVQQKFNQPQVLAETLMSLSEIYRRRAQYVKMQEYCARALTLVEPTGDKLAIAGTLRNMGLDYIDLHQPDKAADCLDRAIREFEAVGAENDISGPLDLLQPSDQPGLYALAAALAFGRSRPMETLLLAERGRARLLARQAARTPQALAHILTPTEFTQLTQRRNELSYAESLLRAASARSLPPDLEGQRQVYQQITEAQSRYQEAEREWSVYRNQLSRENADYRRLKGASPPTLAQLSALARRYPDTIFVEWTFVGDFATILSVITARDGPGVAALKITRIELARQVGQWRKAIGSGNQAEEHRHARALYASLFAPLERVGVFRHRRYRRLVLIPDGPLQDVPFTALMDASGHRLVERFAVSTSFSLGVLTWPDKTHHSSGTLLCAADPIGTNGQTAQSQSRGGFARLPYARREGSVIAHLFPGAVSYFGPQARKATIKRQMGRYAILHFATHGYLDTSDGLRSALVLAPEPPGSPEDGFLDAQEIAEMGLSAQLAVLSACQTAQGQRSGGEGLMGLAWAFRAAGCPSIVASQWEVDDAATSQLMIVFYKGLKRGLRKDEALRKAMLRVKRAKPDPYYWAAFQVIGNTDRITLPPAMR